MVTVVELRSEKVIANITDVPAVHGVLAVPELAEAFATAAGRNRLDVISEKSFSVIAQAPAGIYPDGMAYAPEARKLYVSDESGRTETVIDTRTNRRIATIAMGGDGNAKLLLIDLTSMSTLSVQGRGAGSRRGGVRSRAAKAVCVERERRRFGL